MPESIADAHVEARCAAVLAEAGRLLAVAAGEDTAPHDAARAAALNRAVLLDDREAPPADVQVQVNAALDAEVAAITATRDHWQVVLADPALADLLYPGADTGEAQRVLTHADALLAAIATARST